MGDSWGELRVGPCGALTRTAPGLAGEVGCVRGQAPPYMERATGLSRRIFSKRKRPLGAVWEIILKQQLQSPLHPAAWCSQAGMWGSSNPNLKHQGECAPGGSGLRPQAPGRVHTIESPECAPIAQKRVSA